MTTHTSTCLNRIVTYDILGDLKVKLTIQQNPFDIPLEDLFAMAARINKKRSFLFVSKVLGKHIPIRPRKGILVGVLLAARYEEVVKEKYSQERETLVTQFMEEEPSIEIRPFIEDGEGPVIIGFAETATALGHAFFEAFTEAEFFHTTREWLEDEEPAITFEEEHSHATSHRAYVNEAILDRDREIILVDDELTTGKTALNMIRSIQSKYPRSTYTVVSILDWRSDENVERFRLLEKELGITIHTVSLVKGTVEVEGEADVLGTEFEGPINTDTSQRVTFLPIQNPSLITFGENSPYTRFTGRFGLTAKVNQEANEWFIEAGKLLAKMRNGSKTLVLGTGEYMYLPMKIAASMGDNVFYHSTTRSPIYPVTKENYGAQNRFSFVNPEESSVQNYVYNISRNQYDDIFIFFEKKVEKDSLQELLQQLKTTKISNINIVYLVEKGGEV